MNGVIVQAAQALAAALEDPKPSQWALGAPDFGVVAETSNDPRLAGVIERTVAGTAGNFTIAIIDFKEATPRYAMYKPDEPRAIGSLGKLAILYAAFQLRQDVRNVLSEQPQGTGTGTEERIRDGATLLEALRRRWTRLGAKGLLKQVAASKQLGHLEHIFDLAALTGTNPASIDFKGADGVGVDLLQERIAADSPVAPAIGLLNEWRPDAKHGDSGESKWITLDTYTFAQRLWMMTAGSDNVAAAICAFDIGIPYIQALMLESELFTPVRNGLWLARNYHDGARKKTRFTATHGELPPSGDVGPRGTARALAALLIALHRDKLITPDVSRDTPNVSREMKRYLRPLTSVVLDGVTVGHPVGTRALTAVGGEFRDAFMKAGLGGANHNIVSDWAYFERPTDLDRQGRAIIVLGFTPDNHTFIDLIAKLNANWT